MNNAQRARQSEIDYVRGYIRAIRDFGIYHNGTQTIGCLETPTKEIIVKILREYCLVENPATHELSNADELMEQSQ